MLQLSSKNKNAFTLAEILLTLTIIGVVAAMSIPALIANTQNQEYVVGFKKSYSTLSNGFKMILAKQGVTSLQDTNLFEGTANHQGQVDLWAKIKESGVFSIQKDCGFDPNAGCFSNNVKYLNGGKDTYTSATTSYYRVNLNDGSSLIIWNEGGSCLLGDNACGGGIVDVNGLKPPNQWGRDVFEFYINSKGQVIPDGVVSMSLGNWHTDCENTSGEGVHCAGRIVEEGWAMNY